MIERWEDPMPYIDEDTVAREKRLAEERAAVAQTGTERTHQAVSFIRGFVAVARDLHETNDYRNRMVAMIRNGHA